MIDIPYLRKIRNALVVGSGYSRVLVKPRQGKRVIAFHEVEDPLKFREKIEWLKEHYEIVSLDELFLSPFGKNTQVAITFDDGYASWHQSAAPILREFKIPAVFFVCSGFVGLNGEDAVYFRQKCLHRTQELPSLTKSQLLDLARDPLFEIGSHTVHHVDLGRPWEKDTLELEVQGDRQSLEDWTGMEVRWFAYPFGGPSNFSGVVMDFLRQNCFSGAFTYIPGFWENRTNRFAVGRDGLDINDPLWVWRPWLDGAYDSLYALKVRMFTRRFRLK